ncbi:MAG: hypothetical protein LUF25_04355 [Phascolarctobacterium sp.]|nr:hypothetical protein [Phascolarctobacterium sp.]
MATAATSALEAGTAKIVDIVGSFTENYAKAAAGSSSGLVDGGAILNRAFDGTAEIENITGYFTNSYVQLTGGTGSIYNSMAYGGSIYNAAENASESYAIIDSITGIFPGNHADAENGAAGGGAIFNGTTSSTN